MWSVQDRQDRRHNISKGDQRRDFERDRDRIMYSSAFQRLAGITQIVRAGEADVFHTRQQHTFKVAQVGKRIAQYCQQKFGPACDELGIDPEVVDAAGLAHDLGHPPFGHAGESTLDKLVTEAGDKEGFEGNAQTFHIIAMLGVRYESCSGLDLTRATMAACMKYPWFREIGNPDREKKWGAYKCDQADFDFARAFHPEGVQTAEAALMDWADDIAYSVHDLEEFHRCRAIPWETIFGDDGEELIGKTLRNWHGAPARAEERLKVAFTRLEDVLTGIGQVRERPYEGSRAQRIALRNMTSHLITRYLEAVTLRPSDGTSGVIIDPDREAEVKLLKQIARQYIISSPALLAQQHGQGLLIRDLFDCFHVSKEVELEKLKVFPPKFLPSRLSYVQDFEISRARFAADCVASLTEGEVMKLHARLFGREAGSVLDPIVR
ncbi:dNTP triphosphohydrolase [Mesorhizobium sp. B2-2-4]|nr:dNTP triphosphohydrolase [Mesorhizobium sp. B2-2-4]TPM65863.1 dNTP triphosphohydrolase [Mesorhizobium sp. B2-2-1]TPN64270.1 dNTP triphosphohydrolase [Mesorhizobium sp. B1-1-1]TPN72190.1 dNTP triphosphohydrolase [Mesorhizobium sp. B1-1-3]